VTDRPVLILGATGQLGSDLVKAGARLGTKAVALGHDAVDVTDPASLKAAFEEHAPRAVVNSAAFHQVDKCEDDPGTAFSVNAVGALHVARAAKDMGARVLYVSTDYVFDGARPPSVDGRTSSANAYVEGDMPRPLNTYGASKLAGEHETLLAHPDGALACRVASLYGVVGARGKGGNFIETILKKARETGGPLQVVSDQVMTPTYTWDAAEAILELADSPATGVVHVTNAGACSWHAFASKAVELCGLDVEVRPVPASTWPSKAARPANSALHGDRLAKILGAPMRPWQDALAAYLKEKGHL
jgi:dTDP-4-dehydrorhamnose reductase